MIQAFNLINRQVVPNWRSYDTTVSLNELSDNSKIKLENKTNSFPKNINSLTRSWERNGDLGHAADLISTAYIDRTKNEQILEAANFVKNHKSAASKLLYDIALITLGEIEPVVNHSESISIDEYKEQRILSYIHKKIHTYKTYLSDNPKNSITWVELSRLYSMLGQKDQALHCMRCAVSLAPNNRFIVRSATRLFVHYKEIDFIHDFLRKNQMTKIDPWITSAEIATATLRGRTSVNMKIGSLMISSNKLSNYSITELASSIGTIELKNGNNKKSKELFRKSLLCPNDNSLAQFQWANTVIDDLHLNTSFTDISKSFEASAIESYENHNWKAVIDHCIEWFLDMPYSRRPLLTGSYVASVFTDDQDLAIDLCNAGLISHPNDTGLINNLAFAMALKGNLSDALITVNKAQLTTGVESYFIKATKGLIYFRLGNIVKGRELYQESIDNFTSNEDKYYVKLAILNYIREEVRASDDKETLQPYMQILDRVKEEENNQPDILFMKNKIISLYKIKFNNDLNIKFI